MVDRSIFQPHHNAIIVPNNANNTKDTRNANNTNEKIRELGNLEISKWVVIKKVF